MTSLRRPGLAPVGRDKCLHSVVWILPLQKKFLFLIYVLRLAGVGSECFVFEAIANSLLGARCRKILVRAIYI